jgi:RNA polymerase sigma-70 factor (ECF subfamily)
MSGPHPFHELLAREVPALRTYGRALSRDVDRADDLVQETLLKAWANRLAYTQNTKLRAWLFTILRNSFYSERRRRSREGPTISEVDAANLFVRPTQEHTLAVEDFAAAMDRLPGEQQEALMLVAVAGLSYEDAAQVCDCAVGTVKSRVNRARNRLAELLGVRDGVEMTADPLMDAALRTAGRRPRL